MYDTDAVLVWDPLIPHSPQVTGGEKKAKISPMQRPQRRPALRGRVQLHSRGVAQPIRPIERRLRERLVGQNHVIEALLPALSRLTAGLNDPRRPLMTALLLGPTGVGKTETARSLAAALFGSESALTRIDCQEYAHGFEMSKLLGSPPGYVGHNIEPLLSQERIDAPHIELRAGDEDEPSAPLPVDGLFGDDESPISLVVFDEVEKAHPELWHALLGVLEEGTLTLGNNRVTSFRRSLVLMTSNVGSRSLGRLIEAPTLGFRGPQQGEPDVDLEQISGAVLCSARKRFPVRVPQPPRPAAGLPAAGRRRSGCHLRPPAGPSPGAHSPASGRAPAAQGQG